MSPLLTSLAERLPDAEPPLDRMRRVAAEAAAAAPEVDREGRFPAETLAALKRERLLGPMVPRSLGGEGLALAGIADLCATLGAACGSSGMIYAMHQIKLSSLVSHGRDGEWHRALMREVAARQMLIASSTTEAGIGGDLRTSICAVERDGERFSLVKEASVISYARYADAILVTARRDASAAGSDQVMVAVRAADYTLEPRGGWDTMGMRGTRSEGFRLVCSGRAEQILPRPFSEIAAQSMLAVSHILWGATWFGIAADALGRAQACVKAAARKQAGAAGGAPPGSAPPGALRLAEATVRLTTLKATLRAAIARHEAAQDDEDTLSSVAFAAEMNALKVAASTTAVEVVQQALAVTGLAGYRNDTPFSVGRHLRDVLSAPLMVANDRILANTSSLLLVSRFDAGLA